MSRLATLGVMLTFWLTALATAADESAILLEDDFSSYHAGLFSSVVGAHTEYHYLRAAAPQGNWEVSTFRPDVNSQRAWRIVEHGGRKAMAQAYKNRHRHFHPMIVAGDPSWQDYTVEVQFVPQTPGRMTGVVFRYQNDRCYYFCGVQDGQAVLKLVRHASAFRRPSEQVLATAPLEQVNDATMHVSITVDGNVISAEINDTKFSAESDAFPAGKVGLVADGPALFQKVRVTATAAEAQRIAAAVEERQLEAERLQQANPKMVLWKKMSLKDFGVGRNARFGDLNNDGQMDVLFGQVLHHGPKDRNSELSCLTAMTFDGEQLWQIGEADPWKDHLTNDVGFQIHDFDGDGRSEVVYCRQMRLIVADGATGETKYSVPTPKLPPDTPKPYNKFARVLGDSLYFCDLRGTGRDADVIIKDRYLNLWALSDRLEVLWQSQCNTGHYPFAYDVDDDGKDELMMGYTLFDDDGSKRWSLDDVVQDHADGVAIAQFSSDNAPMLLCAASDEGMFFADLEGNILKHHYIGHVQNPAIADFSPDLPGLEAVSINFWGNQGIVHFYGATGDIYHDCEPCQHGSMCLPVNWTGSPGEFWVLSANVRQGGMFDGWGRRVVKFPADGHPDLCNAVLNIMGDARDEVVVWDQHEMWVYTQDDNPIAGRLYKPERNPLYNYSNYQTTVSLPGWSE